MKKILIGLFCFCLSLMYTTHIGAEEIGEAIATMLGTHERMLEAEAVEVSAQESVRVALGGWFPRLSLTAYAGASNYKLEDTDDRSLNPHEIDASVTQLLWDFGLTNAELKTARKKYLRATANKELVRQGLILEGQSAYLRLKQSQDLIQYARQSIDNIKRQTDMETARISRGQGYSTDVLQSKSQLLGAQSRLVRYEGSLEVAINRAQRVFDRSSAEISALTENGDVAILLPAGLDEALKISLENSPDLKVADFAVQEADAAVAASKAKGYFPKLNGVLGANTKDEVNGTEAQRDEYIAKVELTYDFNLGLTSSNKVRSARENLRAAQMRRADIRNQVVEETRNAWRNVETARANASLLRNQAEILEKFLGLARKERKLGRRSLLDVLAGETNLINAQSDAASAETEVKVYTYALLRAMGKL
jgi:outer membrane protein, adhesin transport system